MTYLRRLGDSWPSLHALLNRGLPFRSEISMQVRWPLFLLPIALFNQIFAPHPVWLVLLIVLVCIYGIGYLWVRGQAWDVGVSRSRVGALLVAGDSLREDFELQNNSHLPVLWAEFTDLSELPGYDANRVVACGGTSSYRWHTEILCGQRGVYRLGPHRLGLADPFGLFRLEIGYDYVDTVLIYPRVVYLPPIQLPHGNSGGSDRRRRPLRGAFARSPFVDEYRPGDSLRYVHWPTTAHRGRLMVKELEIEPSGDVWIVLDLNSAAHSGEGAASTLEFAIVLAASLTAELLSGRDRRAVGLLTTSGVERAIQHSADSAQLTATDSLVGDPADRAVLLPPMAGQAQLWNVLAALAPVRGSDVPLSSLLRNSRDGLGRRRTMVVITPQGATSAPNQPAVPPANLDEEWLAELVHLRAQGLDSSVILVAPAEAEAGEGGSEKRVDVAASPMQSRLAQQELPAQLFRVGAPLQTVLTFRRKRTVTRTTPSGGVVTYEVEEEVG
ncbi:MAG: DUF58 domain-containing protein [Caldilineaceae bacterium]|nr:DUF58 domain-containing protein [Caldilineaceae bacterium]